MKKATCTHCETCQSKPWTRGAVVDVIVMVWLLLLLMLGAGADVMGIYKSVIDIMGLHGGCSPVVLLTLAMSSTLVVHTTGT